MELLVDGCVDVLMCRFGRKKGWQGCKDNASKNERD